MSVRFQQDFQLGSSYSTLGTLDRLELNGVFEPTADLASTLKPTLTKPPPIGPLATVLISVGESNRRILLRRSR